MGRIAFVFSGQGDQHPGMGQKLYSSSAAARGVFDRCDALRPGTARQCFSGTEAELRETKNTQPCLFAMELAAAEALGAAGLRADAAAGFSLGELSALTYAGAMDLEEGFSLVCRRGALMQADAEKHACTMAAVLKLSAEEVAALCAAHEGIYPVNFNCPGQVSVSGPAEGMAAFYADVRAAGGRALPLKVAGGFHSPYMADAAAAFSTALDSVALSAPAIPVYSDVTALPYPDGVADVLRRQIASPVQWEKLIGSMIQDGIGTFIEIGPGKTLTNLIGRISKSVRAFASCNYEDPEALIKEVTAC